MACVQCINPEINLHQDVIKSHKMETLANKLALWENMASEEQYFMIASLSAGIKADSNYDKEKVPSFKKNGVEFTSVAKCTEGAGNISSCITVNNSVFFLFMLCTRGSMWSIAMTSRLTHITVQLKNDTAIFYYSALPFHTLKNEACAKCMPIQLNSFVTHTVMTHSRCDNGPSSS